jgi:hypothetical protein
MSGYTILSDPGPEHEHSLPNITTVSPRTIARCDGCGQLFWLAEGEYGYGWARLRWYHWRLRRCLT